MFIHSVYFWLNDANQQANLLQDVGQLAKIAGVTQFSSGVPVPSERPVVDSSYQVAISMDLQDEATHEAYQTDPIHEQFLDDWIRSGKVSKVQVFDFS